MMPASLLENVLFATAPAFSVSSRSIQPKFVVPPVTHDCTALVNVALRYALFAAFWPPPAEPISNDVEREAVGGLFSDVPKGWLFQVIVPSDQTDVAEKTSYVRHTTGRAGTKSRSEA